LPGLSLRYDCGDDAEKNQEGSKLPATDFHLRDRESRVDYLSSPF